MNFTTKKLVQVLDQVDRMLLLLDELEANNQEIIGSVHSIHKKSARNLIHYLGIRNFDLRKLQKRLKNLGMSRLARSEAHVFDALLHLRFILRKLLGYPIEETEASPTIKESKRILAAKTKALLGEKTNKRRVRIMVTMPTTAAEDQFLIQSMVHAQMNVARINCAHDSPDVWKQMIQNIREVSTFQDHEVKVAMDLAGPKMRTGPIAPGPEVRKVSPKRNLKGEVVQPAEVRLVANPVDQDPVLVVGAEWLQALTPESIIDLWDARGKKRQLTIFQIDQGCVTALCSDTVYFENGTELNADSRTTVVSHLPALEQSIILRPGDELILSLDPIIGQPAQIDNSGAVIRPASIALDLDQDNLEVATGDPIGFDDGKIEGVIEQRNHRLITVRITKAKQTGSRLKAEKGVNLPSTSVSMGSLTVKDQEDLKFVAATADLVNVSFVNSAQDVDLVLQTLNELNASQDLGVVLKIETKEAFNNLAEIVLHAMKWPNIGVMIARGDLAIECGWDNIGWIQKEILSICSAGHIPVIWATQVLENLAKKGLPSRSEITDASTSLKAECVMLNKGSHIIEAIRLLDKILVGMENYSEKEEAMLPQLSRLVQ